MKRCPQCGWCGPPTTNRDDGLCYECLTGSKTEHHHPWNKASFPELKSTIPVPGNVNQALGRRCAERCDALKRPGDDPLHRIAAAMRAIGEGCTVFADLAARGNWPPWVVGLASLFAKAAKGGADWLLMLAGALERQLGPDWATKLEMPNWSPPETER